MVIGLNHSLQFGANLEMRSFLATIKGKTFNLFIFLSALYCSAITCADGMAVIDNTDQFDIRSEKVGDIFRIQIGLPSGYEKGEPYKLVYILDGNKYFGAAAALSRAMYGSVMEPGFPQLIAVGIGYPDGAHRPVLRRRDFTVHEIKINKYLSDSAEEIGYSGRLSGGADSFFKFIEKELDPLIRKKYQTGSQRSGLIGHSLGGQFGIYAFLQQPTIFDRYWWSSPALGVGGGELVEKLSHFIQESKFSGERIFVTVGEEEIDYFGESYLNTTAELEDVRPSGLVFDRNILASDSHATAHYSGMARAFRFLFQEESIRE